MGENVVFGARYPETTTQHKSVPSRPRSLSKVHDQVRDVAQPPQASPDKARTIPRWPSSHSLKDLACRCWCAPSRRNQPEPTPSEIDDAISVVIVSYPSTQSTWCNATVLPTIALTWQNQRLGNEAFEVRGSADLSDPADVWVANFTAAGSLLGRAAATHRQMQKSRLEVNSDLAAVEETQYQRVGDLIGEAMQLTWRTRRRVHPQTPTLPRLSTELVGR